MKKSLFLLFTLLVTCVSGAWAQVGDSMSDPYPLTIGLQPSNLWNWCVFTADTGGTFSATIEGTINDVDMYVLKSDGSTELASTDDATTITATLPSAGTYYLKIYKSGSSSFKFTDVTIPGIIPHDCDFTGDWQNDDNEHWKECPICGTISNKAAHTWESSSCSVCGRAKPTHFTIHDAVTTTSHLPIYGYWADASSQCNQMLYPSTDFSVMSKGDQITKITFYSADNDKNWSCSFDFYITETSLSSISSVQSDKGTKVFTGNAQVNDGMMVITFTSPYTWNGENILLTYNQTCKGSYSGSSFYGTQESNDCSVMTYNDGNLYLPKMLPKIKVDYIPGTPQDEYTVNYVDAANTSTVLYSTTKSVEQGTAAPNADEAHWFGWTQGEESRTDKVITVPMTNTLKGKEYRICATDKNGTKGYLKFVGDWNDNSSNNAKMVASADEASAVSFEEFEVNTDYNRAAWAIKKSGENKYFYANKWNNGLSLSAQKWVVFYDGNNFQLFNTHPEGGYAGVDANPYDLNASNSKYYTIFTDKTPATKLESSAPNGTNTTTLSGLTFFLEENINWGSKETPYELEDGVARDLDTTFGSTVWYSFAATQNGRVNVDMETSYILDYDIYVNDTKKESVSNGHSASYSYDVVDGDIVYVKKIYATSGATVKASFARTATATVSEAGYATWVAPFAVTASEGVAFAAQVNGNYVHLEGVTTIPAGGAVIVKGEGTHTFVKTTGVEEFAVTNDLKSSSTDVTIDGKQYILANGNNGIGFYQATGTIAAGKGYLVIPAGTSAKFVGFGDDATGINAISAEGLENAVIYNLNGQRVQNAHNGIFIVNGKKMFVK